MEFLLQLSDSTEDELEFILALGKCEYGVGSIFGEGGLLCGPQLDVIG